MPQWDTAQLVDEHEVNFGNNTYSNDKRARLESDGWTIQDSGFEAHRLRVDYYLVDQEAAPTWRLFGTLRDALRELGAAGFELVTHVQQPRDEWRGSDRYWFKRPTPSSERRA